jgi:hypothetical protein
LGGLFQIPAAARLRGLRAAVNCLFKTRCLRSTDREGE